MKNSKILSFHAHPELEKQIKELAVKEQRSIANIIQIALDNYFYLTPEDQAARPITKQAS